MWGGRVTRGVSIATKFCRNNNSCERAASRKAGLLQLFFPKEKLKYAHKRLSIFTWSQYPQIIKIQIPPPHAQTSYATTPYPAPIGSSLQMLDCLKPNSFQIIESRIVILGLTSRVVRVPIRHNNNHSLSGSCEKHPVSILLVGLTIWFLDEIPLFTDK